METRVVVTIETPESESRDIHFEWNMSKTVNVFSETDGPESIKLLDTFSFQEQPSLEQVITACEAYTYGA